MLANIVTEDGEEVERMDGIEEEDDTHLCIKCNTEIIGLGNYIEHRKSFCSTTKLINKTGTSASRGATINEGGASSSRTGRASSSTAVAATSTAVMLPKTPSIANNGTGTIKTAATVAPVKTSSGVINNTDRVKLKEPDRELEHGPNRDEEEEQHRHEKSPEGAREIGTTGGFGMKLPGPSFGGGDDDVYTYDYEGADLFFSSLQLQSSSKGNLDRSAESAGLQRGGKGGMLTRSQLYQMFDEESEDDDEEESEIEEPEHEEDDEQSDWEDFEGYGAPPRTFTGGKWKPDMTAHPTTGGKWKPEMVPHPTTGGKWKPGNQPHPTTGGKWKPGMDCALSLKTRTMSETSQVESNEWTHIKPRHSLMEVEDRSYMCPPQNHTRGKWIPGKRSSSELLATSISTSPVSQSAIRSHNLSSPHNAGYKSESAVWCSVCNRKLASQVVYERHLKSNLHLSRVALDNELEAAPISSSSSVSARGKSSGSLRTRSSTGSASVGDEERKLLSGDVRRGKKASQQKRAKSSRNPSHQDYSIKVTVLSPVQSSTSVIRQQTEVCATETKPQSKDKKREKVKKLLKTRKPRAKVYGRCNVCRMRLPLVLLGRHLISHMHYRRMQEVGRRVMADAMVLENLDLIVPLSPFQCQICRFYATQEEEFMRHWWSKMHQGNVANKIEKMWCSFCQFEGSPREMDGHLLGASHREVIQAFNRTVPIIIRERTDLSCPGCKKTFQYNLAIRKHKCSGTIEEDSISGEAGKRINTASDLYQSVFDCTNCDRKFRSLNALTFHQSSVHQLKSYNCSVCRLTFSTAEDALKHRSTVEHKLKIRKLKQVDTRKTCPICSQVLDDLIQLKAHMKLAHPEQMSSCLLCGEKFAIYQELSRHIRDQACNQSVSDKRDVTPKMPRDANKDGKHSCTSCSYRTESEAEITYHKLILHSQGDLRMSKDKIPCPWCDKSFPRNSLLPHLRKHKNERIFGCNFCKKSYPRKQNLTHHLKSCDGSAIPEKPIQWSCQEKGCDYMSLKKVCFKKHAETHLERKFKCTMCNYKTQTMRYLEKHVKGVHKKGV